MPVVKEQSIQNFFKSILDNISPRPIKEQKSYLEEIIKPFIPQWNEVIQKRLRVIQILAQAAREAHGAAAQEARSAASGSK